MAVNGKNIFVSHVREDEAHIEKLKSLLAKNGFGCKDSSITSETPNAAQSETYIKYQILSPQIKWASTVVVLITPETRNSEWVNWEIEHANQLGKRIVGVWVHGAADCDVPEALDKYADAVVGWNAERITSAITGEDNGWEKADGSQRGERMIDRIRCQ